MNPKIPINGEYRGVALHAFQEELRLKIVRAAIDDVFGMADLDELAAYLRDFRNPPEARLLAAARIEARYSIAADKREARPDIDIERVRACVVGLDSLKWIDPYCFGSVLHPHPPGLSAPTRPRPLTDAEMGK